MGKKTYIRDAFSTVSCNNSTFWQTTSIQSNNTNKSNNEKNYFILNRRDYVDANQHEGR